MRKTITMRLVLLVLLIFAGNVEAKVGPPIKIRLLGEPRAAETGKPYQGTVEITTQYSGQIADFHFEGQDWSATNVLGPDTVDLVAGEKFEMEFTALPNDPEKPLTLVFTFEGREVRKEFDLSRRTAAIALGIKENGIGVTRMIPGSDQKPFPGLDSRTTPSEPLEQSGNKTGQLDSGEPEPEPTANVRIFGRLVYERSDGVIVGADGAFVEFMDENFFSDYRMGYTYTDAYGYFDATVNATESEPDIYLIFHAGGSGCQVQTATWEANYDWETSVWDSYSESTLNAGWSAPFNESDHPALHIHTNIVRTRRWISDNHGYSTPSVDVQWPDGSTGAYYTRFWEEIHISSGSQWRESTLTHEFGHHWMNNFAVMPDIDYCNGYCDDPDDCGHCLWCEESTNVALSEGWPDWLADKVPGTYAADYGLAALHINNLESLYQCHEDGWYGSPWTTEGFFAALLRDIEDDTQDDHSYYSDYLDVLAVGSDEIFQVLDLDHPQTPLEFLLAYVNRYPDQRENLWETGKNCGYEFDSQVPRAPTNLTSSSHGTSGESPDPTIRYTWTRPYDDASGVDGYGLSITASPTMPSPDRDIGDYLAYTTNPLPPGSYYFNIRTLDRSGKWGDTYVSYGPITIRDPEPSDLAFVDEPLIGWEYSLVPRGDENALFNNVTVPGQLPGNTPTTYWNLYGRNLGESPTSTTNQTHLLVDGVNKGINSWGIINAGVGFLGLNLGPPFQVRGGRHTLEAQLDATNQIAETDETNNVWGHQFIWTPLVLSINDEVTRNQPPDVTAGWDATPEDDYYNCDGFRFNSLSTWWLAVYLRAEDHDSDYDCRLHEASTGAEDGFRTNIGWGSRGAGCLDAVLVNRNVIGTQEYDVGIINFGSDTGDFVTGLTGSSLYDYGDSVTVSMAQDEYILLREFQIESGEEGPLTLTVDIDPAQGPVYAIWLDETFATGDLLDANAQAVSDPVTGRSRIQVGNANVGYHCLVVYRDQKDGGAPLDVTFEIERTPPDFVPLYVSGWHSPLVPRPTNDGTILSVPLPDVLFGNTSSTYLNLTVRNDGPTDSPLVLHTEVLLDGAYLWDMQWGTPVANANLVTNLPFSVEVPGGRHSLTYRHDPDNEIEEISDTNNHYGEQYIWTPRELTAGSPVVRNQPGDISGGYLDLESGEVFWYNCDGLRSSGELSFWTACAVMPGADSDVDVRLHELSTGAKDGFGANLARSGWGLERSDFVMVNFNNTLQRHFDFGVLDYGGEELYTTSMVISTELDPLSEEWGPFGMDSQDILHLWEFFLPEGEWSIQLDNISGGIDFGMGFYSWDGVYLGKSDALINTNTTGSGGNETLTTLIDIPGYYCLAVWKNGSDDLALNGQYRLQNPTGISGVQDFPLLPEVTTIAGAEPNPFNPQTSITFHLAVEGMVSLEVYDVRGQLVRGLLHESLPAGSHAMIWDGRDQSGRPSASGVYMARLKTRQYDGLSKMMLVK